MTRARRASEEQVSEGKAQGRGDALHDFLYTAQPLPQSKEIIESSGEALPSSRKEFSPPSGGVAQKSPTSDKGFRGFLHPRRLRGEVLLEIELPSTPPRLHASHGCLLCTGAPAVAVKACADILVLFHLNNRFLNNGSE